ncbi:MAG: ABC transporter permease [Spirochaetales bacterium]|nr:ABC transporter permease [Spirochaetales bacterium]
MTDFLTKTGKKVRLFYHVCVDGILQLPDNVSVIFKIFFYHDSIFRDNFLREFYHSGIKCLPIAALTAGLISIATMRGVPYFLEIFGFNAEILYGKVFELMLFDIAPLFAGIIVAVRASVYITMRLAQMKTEGEVDLLEMMGVDPLMYLGSMTVFAGILTIPFVSLYFIFIQLIIALLYLFVMNSDITITQFIFCIIPYLTFKNFGQLFLKTMLSGLFVYLFSVYNGLAAKKGSGEIVSRTINSILFSEVTVILIAVSALIFW